MLEFFLDENLAGKKFTKILLESDVVFQTPADLGFRGTVDHIWIPRVSAMGLVIVSIDNNIRYIESEKQAIIHSGARVVSVSIGKTSSIEKVARNLVHSLPVIERHLDGVSGPVYLRLTMANDTDFEAGKAGPIRRLDLF